MYSGGCSNKISVKALLVGFGLFALVPLGQATTIEYRSYDGSGNNQDPMNTNWGAAGTQLIRLGAASYSDGSSPSGALPSTRDVSNAVVKQTQSVPNANGVSAMLMQWGQFLDHDLDLTRAGTSESMPIAIRSDDPVFGGNYSGSGMPFQRSVFDTSTGTADDNPRQQVNAVTAFIDASQIYGSIDTEAKKLRDSSGGKLKMSGDMLHMLHMLDSTDDGKDNPTFVSGDERTREQVGLTSMHTLFNREHNRLAAGFEQDYRALHPYTGSTQEQKDAYEMQLDEEVYQQARKVVGAMMQSITYNEFLPALLGKPLDDYTGYKSTVNPGIANEFSTAAYRFGHSTLNTTLLRLDADGAPIAGGNLALRDAFFTPETLLIADNGGIDPILRGLLNQRAQEVDPFVVDDVRDFLFGPMGFDLAALNMQRGRDHGLPSYIEMRNVMFGTQPGYVSVQGWTGLQGLMAEATIDALKSVYGSDDKYVNDIDLWIGGLAENHVNGGMLGELFSAIVGDQFSRLRDGDRFWYQNEMFETEWMEFIEGSTLSAIIMRNTGITGLQANVFFVPEPGVLLLLSIGIAGMGMRRKSCWRCAG